MKKMAMLLMVVTMAVSLSACATVRKEEKARVKCPACGYEFEVPGAGR